MKKLLMIAAVSLMAFPSYGDTVPKPRIRDIHPIPVEWYMPEAIMITVLGIISVFVLRRMQKRDEKEKSLESKSESKQKGE